MDLGRPAAIRIITRARLRVSPPIPETLRAWVAVLTSEEWSPRMQINYNGQMVPFFQGPLEILHTDNTIEFVGIVFSNVAFLNESGAHMRSVNTLCMDGTFQVRPQQPQNDLAIRNAWAHVESGNYTLQDFLRNVSFTPEQILRNELGEPNFAPQPIEQANIQLILPPPQLHQPLILGPMRPPPPPPFNQPLIRPLGVQQHHVDPLLELRPPLPEQLPPVQRRAILIRGRGRRNGRPYPLRNGGRGHGRGQIARRAAAEAWAWFDRELNNEVELNIEERQQQVENEEIFEICIICCENLINVITIPCRHKFCRECIERWMQENHQRCPLCRDYINIIQNS
uniref:E3 ubiquitin-protein ligase n=1 Tax=Schizaphis graminum TaxID=13262 RepID=A0A2S2NFS6_SCHGA